MVRVVQSGRFSIYVYVERGERHHLPHCHVRWSDGSTAVRLPDLIVLGGDPLPRAAVLLLDEHRTALTNEWNRLNPERPIR